ncbi:uncharacterized protein LOC143290141 [Babylonia areolata]|uniref:uncharacterized protein LOC143290141 n=1 Tax=Babylonia areolata TaxID=304850 RepID=UPI003FD1FF61
MPNAWVLVYACLCLVLGCSCADYDKDEKGRSSTIRKLRKELADCQEHLDFFLDRVILENGYTLAFRGTAGIDKSVYDKYTSDDHDDTPKARKRLSCDCLKVKGRKCKQHYKSRIITGWHNRLNIEKVRVSVYHKGEEKMYLEFNGFNSTYLDFFSQDRLIGSSFIDLDINTPTNYFSIQGHERSPDVQRRFFVNRRYGGRCDHDEGWLLAVDANDNCDYTSRASFPVFLYAGGNTSAIWSQDTKQENEGDTLVVAVQFPPSSTTQCKGKLP